MFGIIRLPVHPSVAALTLEPFDPLPSGVLARGSLASLDCRPWW